MAFITINGKKEYVPDYNKKLVRNDTLPKAATPTWKTEKPTTTTPFTGTTATAKKTTVKTPTVSSISSVPKVPASGHKSVTTMTPEAQELRRTEIAKSPIMQTAGGIAYGFLPFAPAIDEDKKTKYTTAGSLIGTLASYGLGYGAAKSGIKVFGKTLSTTNLADKALKTSKATKAISTLSKNRVIRNIASKELKRAGKEVTEKAVKELAETTAKNALHSVVREGVTDFTAGAVLDVGQSQKRGVETFSDDWWKEMGKNALINVAVGGAIEAAPYVAKSLSKAKTATKEIPQLEIQKPKAELPTKEITADLSIPKVADDVIVDSIPKSTVTEATEPLEAIAKQAEPTNTKLVTGELPKSYKQRVVTKSELPVEKPTTVKKTIPKDVQGTSVKDSEFDMGMFEGYEDFPKGTIIKKGSKKAKETEKQLLEILGEEDSTAVKNVFDNVRSLEGREKIIDQAEVGKYLKDRITNKETTQQAIDAINENGVVETLKELRAIVDNGLTGDLPAAKSFALLKKFSETGNQELIDTISDIAVHLNSNSGKSLQIAKMLSPVGKVKVFDNRIKRFIKSHPEIDMSNPEIAKLYDEFKVNKLKSRNINRIEDPLKRKAALEQYEKDMFQQSKKIMDVLMLNSKISITDIWERFVVTNMLASLKTQGRNVIGNASMFSMKSMDRVIDTQLQKIAKIPIEQRDVAWSTPMTAKQAKTIGNKKLAEVYEFAEKQLDSFSMTTEDGLKMLDNSGRRDLKQPFFEQALAKLPAGKQVGKALDARSRFWLGALELEDKSVMIPEFNAYWYGFMKAKGIKNLADMTDDLIKEANAYAYEEMLDATFRNSSKLGSALQGFISRKLKSSNLGGKAVGVGLKIDVPFIRVPANVLRASIQHEPLYLLKGAADIAKAGKSGDVEMVKKALTELSKGLTGTGLALLGGYLSSIGTIKVNATDQEKLEGKQDFSIEVGGKSLSIGWAAPFIVPILMGVMVQEKVEERTLAGELEKEDPFDSFIDLMYSMPDLITEMTMLQGISQMFEKNYNDESFLVTVLRNTAENGLQQLIPREITQAGELATKDRYSTLSTEENVFDKLSDTFGKRIESKTTFPIKEAMGEKVPKMYDQWGRPVESDSPLEVLLSPSRVQDINLTPVDEELNKLSSELPYNKEDVFPSKSYNYEISFDANGDNSKTPDETIRMTDVEYSLYSKVKGENSYKALEELFASKGFADLPRTEQEEILTDWVTSDSYKKMSQAERDAYFQNNINTGGYDSMTADEKRKAINGIYTQASKDARESVLKSRGVDDNSIEWNNVNSTTKSKKLYSESSLKDKYGLDLYFTIKNMPTNSASGTPLKDELVYLLDNMDLSNSERAELFTMFQRTGINNPYE